MIKLPAGKYTVREREMLSGVAGAPESYFMPGNAFSNSIYGGEPRPSTLVPFLGKPEVYTMPREAFFNSIYSIESLGRGTAVGALTCWHNATAAGWH